MGLIPLFINDNGILIPSGPLFFTAVVRIGEKDSTFCSPHAGLFQNPYGSVGLREGG
jgi:hypothetical protein